MPLQRRAWLRAALALGVGAGRAPLARAAALPQRLAAAWDDVDGRHHAGLLALDQRGLRVLAAIELPSRAHGLVVEPQRTLLVAARRPGDWLLRWSPGAPPQWLWSEPDRRFTGHLLRAPGGERLYSVETELDGGLGRIGVRDARSFELLADWPTHGIDPHQLLLDADGSLLVANGGVPTQPETGRAKRGLERMDASLVRLGGARGELRGQWRLDDPRLSIRHLARHRGGVVGLALQAEHDEPARKAEAPLLALFDGQALRPVAPPLALAGYAGDIVATDDGFALSAPRADRVAAWSPVAGWRLGPAFDGACALARTDHGLLAAGSVAAGAPWDAAARSPARPIRVDNHWVVAEIAP